MIYNIKNRKSIENLNSWLKKKKKNGNKNVYKLLIGNKSDLESNREIKKEEGEEFASINGLEFFETSAKENYQVQEAFITLARDIIKTVSKEKNKEVSHSIKLKKPGASDNLLAKEKKCCKQ